MNPNRVYLVQTDTTVGFSSSSDEKLCAVKQRPKTKKILNTVDSFKTLNSYTRVPKKFKKQVRNSIKTTFIYPNLHSFRVVNQTFQYNDFLSKFNILYSTSANLTGNSFDKEFALENSDVIVYSNEGFKEKASSSIYRLYKNKKTKIR